MDVRIFLGWFDDFVIKDLDSRLCKEVAGIIGKVNEVNNAICDERCSGTVDELKRRLKVLGSSIEKQPNNLFSQV
ncbi:hypothetical protein OROHE_016284 [Orobanche hederae]